MFWRSNSLSLIGQSGVTLILLTLLACPASVSSQDLATVRGDVTTSTGSPIHRARVMVLTADASDTLAVLFTNAQGHYENRIATNVGFATDVPQRADRFWISPPFPNPAGAGESLVTIFFATPTNEPARPRVQVFDVLGRSTDVSTNLASGLYFVRLHFGGTDYSQSRSLVVTAPGPIQFSLRHEVIPDLIDATPGAAGVAKRGERTSGDDATERLAAVIRVEKDGYVTEETTGDLTPETPTTADFQLGDAPLPSASFVVSGSTSAGGATLFDASASSGGSGNSGEVLTYAWSFGDDVMGGGRKLAHVYTDGGTYDVTLTVVGDYGAKASTTQQVAIATLPPPVSQDGTLMGSVSDIAGFGLGDVVATIVGSGASGTTNPFGAVTISDVSVGVPLTVRLSRPGYAAQVVQVGVLADTSSVLYFEAAMRPRDTAIEITDAENGFRKRGRDGVMVELPVDALVRMDGTPATGAIQMSMTPVDVSDPEEVRSFPGRFEGVLPNGDDALLLSLGTAEYNFTQGTEPLQLAPGKSARIEIPIYTSDAAVGDTIPLWSMNEKTGAWVQEGVGLVEASGGSPSGLVLVGQVSHFSWWNCDHWEDDIDEAEGLCYKYECFNGICNKVKVYCWVEGAIHGDTDKQAQLSPPVFSARTFFPAEGGTVKLPGGRDVTLRGTVLLGNTILRGDTTFVPVSNGASQFELILDTVSVADVSQVQVPFDTTNTFADILDLHVYEFQGRAGQVVAYQGSRISGPSVPGSVELRAEDETILSTRGIDGTALMVKLPADGKYRFVVTASQSVAAEYALRVRTVSGSVQVNSNTSVELDNGDFQLYQFTAAGEMLSVGALAPGAVRRTEIVVYNSDLQPVGATPRRDVDSGPFQVGNGVHYVIVKGTASVGPTVAFGLSEVFPENPVLMSFDGNGASDVVTSFSYHGQYRYYEFDGETGDGFELSFYREGDQRVEDIQFKIFSPLSGQLPSISPNAGWNESIVQGWGMVLPQTGRYGLVVNDGRFASVGGFEVRLRKVSPSSSIVIDDDLSCPGAATTSVTAAMYAVEDGGTVMICDGIYESPTRVNLSGDNVTVTGESEAGTVLRFVDMNRSPGSVLDIQGQNVSWSNMTIESGLNGAANATNAIVTFSSLAGTSATFENLTLQPIEAGGRIGSGIRGDYDDVVIRNITYSHGFGTPGSALLVNAVTSMLLENSTFDAPVVLRGSAPNNATITVDGLVLSAFAQTIENAGVVEVRNSTIPGAFVSARLDELTLRDNLFIRDEQSGGGSVRISDIGVALVVGNTINRGMEVTVFDGQIAAIRRNRFLRDYLDRAMIVSQQTNTTGGSVIVENNVIDAARRTDGAIWIYRPETLGSALFANNTIVGEQLGNSTNLITSLQATTTDPSYTGLLPITLVNNIFVGDNTTAIRLTAGTSVDADYNVFYNYDVIVAGGTNSTGSNNLTSDPDFSNADYELNVGSPAIDSGASLVMYPGLPLIDFLGVVRPQGTGYDRGAYEK